MVKLINLGQRDAPPPGAVLYSVFINNKHHLFAVVEG
jgi:hypothetical protein